MAASTVEGVIMYMLNIPNHYCVLCWQAKRAVQRGATAVIFDVSENPDAIDQVCTHLELPRHSHSPSNLSQFVCDRHFSFHF